MLYVVKGGTLSILRLPTSNKIIQYRKRSPRFTQRNLNCLKLAGLLLSHHMPSKQAINISYSATPTRRIS